MPKMASEKYKIYTLPRYSLENQSLILYILKHIEIILLECLLFVERQKMTQHALHRLNSQPSKNAHNNIYSNLLL